MLGFQTFGRGLLRTATRFAGPKMSTFMPKHVAWSFQYQKFHHRETVSALSRVAPVPGAGLSILNLREIL